MKKARYGTTPVAMPRIPGSIGGVVSFAQEVRHALRALRDRPVLVPSDVMTIGGGGSHPWKATANGDDTVAVAAGPYKPRVSLCSPTQPFECSPRAPTHHSVAPPNSQSAPRRPRCDWHLSTKCAPQAVIRYHLGLNLARHTVGADQEVMAARLHSSYSAARRQPPRWLTTLRLSRSTSTS